MKRGKQVIRQVVVSRHQRLRSGVHAKTFGPGGGGDDDQDTGDEPLIDAQAISASWGKVWPKVVARAWMEESRQAEKGEGKPSSDESADQEPSWYENLMSMDPDRVRQSLIAVGFTPEIQYDNEAGNPEYKDLTWFWENLKIVVKRRGDGVEIAPRDGEKNFRSVPSRGEIDGQYKYEKPKHIVVFNGDQEIHTYLPRNGWKDMEGLEHVLVLTIPPKPPVEENMAMALADYEATGRVYPFTFCC